MRSGEPRAPPSTTLLLKVEISNPNDASSTCSTCQQPSNLRKGTLQELQSGIHRCNMLSRVVCRKHFSTQDIAVLETLSQDIGRLSNASVFVEGNVVRWVGRTEDTPPDFRCADNVISLPDHVVIPGLVNSHTHMWQSLTRCIAQVITRLGPLHEPQLHLRVS